MRKLSITLILCIFTLLGVQAQAPSPVRWRATATMTSPTQGVITLRALVDEGWHFWGMDQAEDGPISLTITYGDVAGMTMTGNIKATPKAVSAMDKTFGCRVSYYDKNVTFTRPFKLSKKGLAGSAIVPVTVRYQTCKDDACLPPKSQTLNVRIPAYKSKK